MKARATTTLVVLVLASGFALQQGTTWSFDELPADRPPPGFAFVSPQAPKASPWMVLRDGTNGVLAPDPSQTAGVNLAIVPSTSFANLTVSARMRFEAGAGSAGVVWRYRDPDNYYLTALDLREQEIRIYRVVRGNRTRLRDEDDLVLDPGRWHLLRVQHQDGRIRAWIDGVPVVDARDRTPQEPGAIGLWTDGRAAAWFDDLQAAPAQGRDRDTRN
jgi:hypothetical protein